MSLTKILLEDTFNLDKFKKLSEFFDKHYFHAVYDRKNKLGYSKYYYGGGTEAMVLYSEKYPDVVIRLSERVRWDTEKLVGKQFDNVVDVKYYKNFRSYDLQVLEKLEEIDRNLRDDISEIRRFIEKDYLGKQIQSHEMYDIINDNKNILKDAIKSVELESSKEDILKLVTDVIKGIKQLNSVPLGHHDLGTHNIMYDPNTDNYKIIDV